MVKGCVLHELFRHCALLRRSTILRLGFVRVFADTEVWFRESKRLEYIPMLILILFIPMIVWDVVLQLCVPRLLGGFETLTLVGISMSCWIGPEAG